MEIETKSMCMIASKTTAKRTGKPSATNGICAIVWLHLFSLVLALLLSLVLSVVVFCSFHCFNAMRLMHNARVCIRFNLKAKEKNFSWSFEVFA